MFYIYIYLSDLYHSAGQTRHSFLAPGPHTLHIDMCIYKNIYIDVYVVPRVNPFGVTR